VLRVFGPAGSLSVGSGAGWRAGKGQLGLEDLLVCLGDVIHLVEPDVALGPVRLIAVRLDPGDQVLVDHRVAEAVRDAEEFEGVALEGAGAVIWAKGGRPPAGWMWLAAMVARSASRVAKLCTGPPPGVALVAALASRWRALGGGDGIHDYESGAMEADYSWSQWQPARKHPALRGNFGLIRSWEPVMSRHGT
jgi:hypothetical protein